MPMQPSAIKRRIQIAADKVVAAGVAQIDVNSGDAGEAPEVGVGGDGFDGQRRRHGADVISSLRWRKKTKNAIRCGFPGIFGLEAAPMLDFAYSTLQKTLLLQLILDNELESGPPF